MEDSTDFAGRACIAQILRILTLKDASGHIEAKTFYFRLRSESVDDNIYDDLDKEIANCFMHNFGYETVYTDIVLSSYGDITKAQDKLPKSESHSHFYIPLKYINDPISNSTGSKAKPMEFFMYLLTPSAKRNNSVQLGDIAFASTGISLHMFNSISTKQPFI